MDKKSPKPDYMKYVGSIFLYRNQKIVVYSYDPFEETVNFHYLKEFNHFGNTSLKNLKNKKEFKISNLTHQEKNVYFQVVHALQEEINDSKQAEVAY